MGLTVTKTYETNIVRIEYDPLDAKLIVKTATRADGKIVDEKRHAFTVDEYKGLADGNSPGRFVADIEALLSSSGRIEGDVKRSTVKSDILVAASAAVDTERANVAARLAAEQAAAAAAAAELAARANVPSL